jgi:hypothetical protein
MVSNPKTTGVFRSSNGALYLKSVNTPGFADAFLTYGLPGDYPIVGDWDGDGIDTIGIYRNGTFYLRNSNTNGFADMVFDLGIPGDIAIAGDWDGDGITTVGVFRPSNGALYLKNSNTTGFADIVSTYGLPGDLPCTGDWDGNGTDTIGVYRGGTFYLCNENTVGFAEMAFALGIPGDYPIAGRWGPLGQGGGLPQLTEAEKGPGVTKAESSSQSASITQLPVTNGCAVAVSGGRRVFYSHGCGSTAEVAAGDNCSWTALIDVAWIEITSGGMGRGCQGGRKTRPAGRIKNRPL